MAMTLRTDPDTEAALERLAARWGVSKQAAALRAVREEDERQSLDLIALSDQLAEEDARLLHRLGTV